MTIFLLFVQEFTRATRYLQTIAEHIIDHPKQSVGNPSLVTEDAKSILEVSGKGSGVLYGVSFNRSSNQLNSQRLKRNYRSKVHETLPRSTRDTRGQGSPVQLFPAPGACYVMFHWHVH